MKNRSRGFTLIEMTTVLAVSAILMASTIPLGSFWTQKAKLSDASGELTRSIGKAIGSALRNPNALDSGDAITAVCVSDTNQLTVLEATVDTAPDCTNGDGVKLWTASLPEKLQITSKGQDVNCLCFNSSGLPTRNQCSSCFAGIALELAVGARTNTLNVR